ncbi:hypothetical protein [Streptomyces sp. NPDC021020]|uniref:hypothetical protein n=1 Tax=Streptomyces sp. NPDC021020 TaxID=3365109 RepID=UPI003787C8D7
MPLKQSQFIEFDRLSEEEIPTNMPGTTAGELCEASARLPLALHAEARRTYPAIDGHRVMEDLVCAFDEHGGGEHCAVVYDDFPDPATGTLWTRWHSGESPTVLFLRPDCPTRSPSATACGHFTAHPGPHSWETDTMEKPPR